MKKNWSSPFVVTMAIALATPVLLLAQDDVKDDKGDKGKKDVQQIIITFKGDKKDKTIVEINGDKVLVNGKPLDELKDKNGDISVRMNKLKDLESLTLLNNGRSNNWNMNNNGGFQFYTRDDNRAMLGVTTEKVEEGVSVQDVTKESAAEKMGLKENDIITKVDDKKIEDPEDLTEAIKAHKPGDKVTVTFLRDKKEQKKTGELTKWKGMTLLGGGPGQNFKMDMGDMNFDKLIPNMKSMQGFKNMYDGQGWSWSGNGPKLGISVQDTDDGKGAKIIEVDEESNAAKAGLKENDIITQIDDKAVNGVDEVTRLIKEKKENPTVKFQVTRNGKTENIEVKMPRKIKTADL